jgi:hypothetical protein
MNSKATSPLSARQEYAYGIDEQIEKRTGVDKDKNWAVILFQNFDFSFLSSSITQPSRGESTNHAHKQESQGVQNLK